MKNKKSSLLALRSQGSDKIIYTSSWATWTPWHTQIFQQICNVKWRSKSLQERNVFPGFGSKELELFTCTTFAIQWTGFVTGHNLLFPASRGLSRRGKMKREEREICRLLTSFSSRMSSRFLNNQWRFCHVWHNPGGVLTISRSEIHQGTGASFKILTNR